MQLQNRIQALVTLLSGAGLREHFPVLWTGQPRPARQQRGRPLHGGQRAPPRLREWRRQAYTAGPLTQITMANFPFFIGPGEGSALPPGPRQRVLLHYWVQEKGQSSLMGLGEGSALPNGPRRRVGPLS